jgi:choline/glycine/proline betaine transport protein
MFKKLRSQLTLNKGITIPSIIFITITCFFAAQYPVHMNIVLDAIKNFIFINLNWVYVWTVSIFVFFMFYLLFSKYGNIKLGNNDIKPQHSFFSWIAMLFAAGMGIGLMYFSVAEPMQHYSNPVFEDETLINRAKNAQLYTFFHWGIHAWAIYGIVGLSLSYFTYRYKLPLSLRSCFYPLLKNRINGVWGNVIDVFALCSTIFGITTTLGFGVVQINSGLVNLNIIPKSSFTYQIIIVCILVAIAILSAISGVSKGIKILSSINIIAVIFLLLFVVTVGPTTHLIGSFTEGLGNYISSFIELTFNTHSFETNQLPWFYDWTILYWAWWISWAPYVGLFIAKISKGRTIKEFIAAVLIIPTTFNFIWMTVFGNSAIWIDQFKANGALSKLAGNPDTLMFSFLEYLPLSSITSILVIIIIIIFFVTSADSGIVVMDNIATKNSTKSSKYQIGFWGVLLALISLALLNAGGLEALQSMTLITALPFSIIMILFIISLVKALRIDYKYYDRDFSITTNLWSSDSWKDKLNQIVTIKNKTTINQFINKTVKNAFIELQEVLSEHEINSKINTHNHPNRIEIEIKYDVMNNFIYGVRNESINIPEYFLNEDNVPDTDSDESFYPLSYFGDNREGYNVKYFTKNELITDVLKHYERFLKLTSEEKNVMFISSNIHFRKIKKAKEKFKNKN